MHQILCVSEAKIAFLFRSENVLKKNIGFFFKNEKNCNFAALIRFIVNCKTMLSNFEISILKLKSGDHSYDFHLDKAFFAFFEFEDVQNADLKVHVKLNKGARVIMLRVFIEGKVELLCDRSLEPFDYEISVEEQVAYKYGENEEVLSDDLIQITANTQTINVAQLLFEMSAFAIPMKKLHPKFADEESNDTLVYSSSTDEEPENPTNDDADLADPRWESLKSLKDKFNRSN